MPIAAGPGVSYSPDLTGGKIIKRAMRLLGALSSGAAVDAQELTDGLEALNHMLDAFNTEGVNIFSLNKVTTVLTSGDGEYTIGIGGDIDVPRPPKIEQGQAYLKDGDIERPLLVYEGEQWAELYNKFATGMPSILYYDRAAPVGNLSLLPVPISSVELVLWLWNLQPQLTSPNDVFSLPPGYAEAIIFNLALRLIPEYGRGGTADIPFIIKTAETSLSNLKRLNSKPGLMRCDEMYLGEGYYDIASNITSFGGSAGGGTTKVYVPAGVMDGVNTVFTLGTIPAPGTLLVFWNGVGLSSPSQYTLVGNTITLVLPPQPGDTLLAYYS